MKFIKENFWWLVLIIVAVSSVLVLAYLPSEHWIRRLLLAPFAVFGGYSIFLGAVAMAEQFEKHIDADWKMVLLFITSIFGVVILFTQFL